MNTKAKYAAMLLVLAGAILLPVTWLMVSKLASSPSAEAYAGSVSCRPCHEEFYRLWASSRHGLAMQPYTAAFAAQNLSPQTTPVHIGDYTYLAQLGQNQGWVLEQGPPGKRKYPIAHVMGGKNVYYFLTSLSRGRLQVLPVAYDVHGRKWFDTAASGVRHFGRARPDSPLHWTDPFYTFNTSCHGCHVSQLSTNYDPATDSYKTTWTEPGINCQTCHGPGRVPRQVHPSEPFVQAGRAILRPFRPGHVGTPGFLPGRARPRRELHLHELADEPLRRIGRTGLYALPHLQRALQVPRWRQARQCVPAVSPQDRG